MHTTESAMDIDDSVIDCTKHVTIHLSMAIWQQGMTTGWLVKYDHFKPKNMSTGGVAAPPFGSAINMSTGGAAAPPFGSAIVLSLMSTLYCPCALLSCALMSYALISVFKCPCALMSALYCPCALLSWGRFHHRLEL
uniref:Uncharacterized protein n=1 Tax=Romanomermis culicivorax TaxID=13658 RepID=A0A915IRY5_ROMCU